MRRQQPVANQAEVILHTVLIPLILQALTVLIHTAVTTLQLLASNMEGHGTVLIANIVHQVLTARPVQLLTAVTMRPLRALKPAEPGRVRIAKCLKVPALLTVRIIPAPATAVTMRHQLALNPAEHGTERLARCLIRAVPAV